MESCLKKIDHFSKNIQEFDKQLDIYYHKINSVEDSIDALSTLLHEYKQHTIKSVIRREKIDYIVVKLKSYNLELQKLINSILYEIKVLLKLKSSLYCNI